MAKLSVGSVLKEGDSLITMMPSRTPMEAEAHIPSRDVGFVRQGDKVTLKIDAFNAAEHGTAEGHINWVSEGAFTADEDWKPTTAYYKARIAIEFLKFRDVPTSFRLVPGTTLSAYINVGRRSLARYIFGGAVGGMGEAMREP